MHLQYTRIAEVKNSWICTSTLPYIMVCCLIKHTENFTLSFIRGMEVEIKCEVQMYIFFKSAEPCGNCLTTPRFNLNLAVNEIVCN